MDCNLILVPSPTIHFVLLFLDSFCVFEKYGVWVDGKSIGSTSPLNSVTIQFHKRKRKPKGYNECFRNNAKKCKASGHLLFDSNFFDFCDFSFKDNNVFGVCELQLFSSFCDCNVSTRLNPFLTEFNHFKTDLNQFSPTLSELGKSRLKLVSNRFEWVKIGFQPF